MYTPYNIFSPEIKKYQTGTAGTTGNTTPTPDKPKIEVGTIFTKNGKTYRVSEVRSQTDFDAEDISMLNGPQKNYTDQYLKLEQTLKDPKVKEAFWKKYQENAFNIKGYGAKKGIKPKKLNSADELVETYLRAQRQMMSLNANFERSKLEIEQLDKNENIATKYLEDIGLDRLDPSDYLIFQKAYKDLGKIVHIDKDIDKEVKDKLKNFKWTPIGVSDANAEDYLGKGSTSYEDSWLGNTTIGQINEVVETPATPQLVTTPKKDEPVDFITAGKFQQPPLPRRKPEFWKQDLVSMINAGMDWASIKKYLPWAKKVDLEEPQYALLDPTWQLQQNAGLLNQQIQGLGAFGTPQSYLANLTGAAGQASEQAQRILADYDTKNAMIQNEGENRKTAVRNQEEMTNAEIATNLYDKTTIANQQFDNAQRAARNKMALAYNNALTNRAMTQAQNLMSAPFQVDPTTGGYVFFDPNLASEMAPSQSDYEIRKQRLDQILQDPAYKNIEDKESIYRMLYPDENFGYPGTRQTRRRQQYQPSYFDMMRMMYPGATGGDPYGYTG